MKDNNSTQKAEITIDTISGAAIYSKSLLRIYDFFVLGLSNTFFWKCPTKLILHFYNQHVSEKHLDIGVGSGYFLDNCKFPNANPHIVLVDLNSNSLEYTAQRIGRYKPTTLLANVFQPLPIESTFDSIGINYLLHCLPGNNILSKGIVFKNLKALLNDGGIIFGTTILGKGISHNIFAQQLMRIYNAKGIFGNTNDTREDLEAILKKCFRTYDIHIVGSVAFFAAWK
ncbi:MAG: class I SAM-dependent methyltransferase [Nostocaceae cyanobacterium]|nr:class I SAM-dependent methyltransferase [Nostocaceae cyanobacterium]